MDAIYLLIPLTLIFLAIAVGIFFWAVNSDQYSDLDKEASRILFEEKDFDEKGGEKKYFEENGHKQKESEHSTKEDNDQPGSKA
ncbi:cbb3-type cytochrome oxidase assembly protein CcoS [Kangiella profundi]|uniref:Cbb3-type cytochrome oxidase assembly protein CcoS n=1 Tax=Kangiella profundi TaxID=1561924 RepID=A0A2K9A2R2_9GAMM|nr:cbb3-type cytochrome oxidase assembly protein CcoS [Kangiella profundi]AUD78155.1 cbb3-type cytochrome oxidase assembly protein CcoS [Kangiella profundi]GGF05561.1 cytochrome oxidase maturation protein Cbb3 [Kangiella profundi]